MADSGTTILNLPVTVALGDTDVIPLARPSGTTAPGTDLGISGAALKSLLTGGGAAKGGVFRGAWAANTAYAQYDSTVIPAGSPNAGLPAYAAVAFTSGPFFLASNWTLFPTLLYPALGQATDGPVTQATVTNAFLQLQAPFVATYANGAVQYFNFWPTPTDATPIVQIRIRGICGDPGGVYIFKTYTSIFLEPGAVFSCSRLIPQSYGAGSAARSVISGGGTILGKIVIYDNTPTVKILITGIRHEGTFFSDVGSNVIAADVKWANATCAPPAGYAYLNTSSRNGSGGGCFYFRYRFFQCRLEVSGTSPASVAIQNALPNTVASAFQLSAFNYTTNATQDASDQANCLLEASGCTFVGDGTSSNLVLSSYGGFATFRFAYNTAYGITPPSAASDPAYVLWPGGGSAATVPAAGGNYVTTDYTTSDYVA